MMIFGYTVYAALWSYGVSFNFKQCNLEYHYGPYSAYNQSTQSTRPHPPEVNAIWEDRNEKP